MKLNRAARRKRGQRRTIDANSSPQAQMKAFLDAPGKIHMVALPDDKSFVVKVTDHEMPLFQTIIGQLAAVLGHCEALPMTEVEANFASTQDIARHTAGSRTRIAAANERSEMAARAAVAAEDELMAARRRRARIEKIVEDDVEQSMKRHPAGSKRSGGRHAKPEADTVLDQLMSPPDSDEDARRQTALEIAAATDAVERATAALDAANRNMTELYERAGKQHNENVLQRFAEEAGSAIADQNVTQEQRDQLAADAGLKHFLTREPAGEELPDFPPIETRQLHRVTCDRPGCDWQSKVVDDSEKGQLTIEYAAHISQHVAEEARKLHQRCICEVGSTDISCPIHGPKLDNAQPV